MLEYQDIWVQGKTIKFGARECEKRYFFLSQFCKRFNGPMRVLDIGSNNGYFPIRLAADHPNWDITAVDPEPKLKELQEKNGLANLTVIPQILSSEQIDEMVYNEYFDLILAMSVIHHFDKPKQVIDHLVAMGNITVFEVGYHREAHQVVSRQKIREIHSRILDYKPIQINKNTGEDRPIYYTSVFEEKFKGIIHGGGGNAGVATMPMMRDRFRDKLGYIPYLGTLNVKLGEHISLQNETMIGKIRVYPVYINGMQAHCIRGLNVPYPTEEIEIIAPYKLRTRWNLEEHDEIDISFNSKYIKKR